MRYLLIICAFYFFLPDTVKKDTVKINKEDIQAHFEYIKTREVTIKEMDTLDIKLNKILELLNDSTKKK